MKRRFTHLALATVSYPLRTMPGLGWLRSLLGNRIGLIGLCILVPVLLLAVLVPILPISDPFKTNVSHSLSSPSLDHPFGTDKLGRDVFARTLKGLQMSLSVGFLVAGITLSFGLFFGTLSGFFGGRLDRLVMAGVDIFLSFPSLLLAIGLVAIFGAGFLPVVAAIAIADIPRAIRLQRSLVLSIKNRAFIDAARMVSASPGWLMGRHLVPNTIAPMLVAASITAANAILTEASLSFLGLGITPPEPSLGNIIREGQMYMQEAWWISTLPGLVILLIAISLHLVSDGIREVLDPRARKS
ncbi:ABC transporter permease [Paenibacillus sp. 1P07SE]|uniref:ABC transporter permease n=1 Tax=Paenibacillus sp. 1P07SE TaxID=3132209 RepID=UPI0039A6FD61